MRLTVRCPADGLIEVTVRDLELVVVRSGSDVEATYRCPLCGSRVQVGSDLSMSLIDWANSQLSGPSPTCDGGCSRVHAPALRAGIHDAAYVEYFRRELDGVVGVAEMLALIDVGERRRHDRSAARRR